jgi:hypothetical protein
MRLLLQRHYPKVTRPMWIFVAAVCLGFSLLLLLGLLGALIAGELRQYSKSAGLVTRVLEADPSGFWLEVGGLTLFALLLFGVGVFAVRAYVTLGKSSDAG